MTNDVNDSNVSSPYKVFKRPKNWKPLPSPRDIPTASRRIKKKLKNT